VVLLVGRGSTDPDANSDVAKVARLLAETTEVRGVEYGFVSLAPPDVVTSLERCLVLGASRVIVLPFFLFTGVLPRRVASQARDWAVRYPGVRVGVANILGDTDTLADLVIERYREALLGQARANCDTCRYRVALPGHEQHVHAPQAPHAHPQDHDHGHHH
jgi:sirohydrochlorin cobaltochelatase